MEKDILMEFDEMRSQFGELKSMLKDQQIVNEKMARRAMKGDYNKVRKDLIFAIVLEVVAIPLQMVLLPLIGMPTWYLVFTVLFLLSALVASVYSLRRYASADMISGAWHREIQAFRTEMVPLCHPVAARVDILLLLLSHKRL